MKHLALITLVCVASSTLASEYPFTVYPFECEGVTFTIVENDEQLSVAGSDEDIEVLRTDKGFLIQTDAEYAGVATKLMNFLEYNAGSWTLTIAQGPDREVTTCTDLSEFAKQILPVLEQQLAGAEETQSELIKRQEEQLKLQSEDIARQSEELNRQSQQIILRQSELKLIESQLAYKQDKIETQQNRIEALHRQLETIRSLNDGLKEDPSDLSEICRQVKIKVREGIKFWGRTNEICELG